MGSISYAGLDDLLCDNPEYEAAACHKEIAALTEDCSPLEIRVLADMIRATKEIIGTGA